MVATFQIIGHKKSGKTTLVNDFLKCAPELKLKIAVVKHTHAPVEIADNTDTGKFFQQSDDVLLLNDSQTIHYQRNVPLDPQEQIAQLETSTTADIIIIEGLKEMLYPKIILLKKDESVTDFGEISNVKNFVSIQQETTTGPVLNIQDLGPRQKFIKEFLRGIQ